MKNQPGWLQETPRRKWWFFVTNKQIIIIILIIIITIIKGGGPPEDQTQVRWLRLFPCQQAGCVCVSFCSLPLHLFLSLHLFLPLYFFLGICLCTCHRVRLCMCLSAIHMQLVERQFTNHNVLFYRCLCNCLFSIFVFGLSWYLSLSYVFLLETSRLSRNTSLHCIATLSSPALTAHSRYW